MTPEEAKRQASLDQMFLAIGAKPVSASPLLKLRELIAKGWRETYNALFTNFTAGLGEHHIDAIEWHWESRIAFLKGEHPQYLAYFPIWFRGGAKSFVAERLVIVDGILSFAYQKPSYALYVCKNKEKVQEHISNIETLLSSPQIRELCPKISNPSRKEITGQQKKWTASFLKSEANVSIQGGTLDSGLAGSRVEDTRPTFLIFDDIDGREDSPVIAEARFRQLTTEILPMRQKDTLVFFPQNLISRYSCMYRIHKGQMRVLTNRKPTQPVPAVRNLVTEQRTIDGIVRDIFISGEPTWHIWDRQRVQDEIDTEGLESFLREAQHEVEGSKEGRIFYNFEDDVHVISESEFASVYGSLDAWLRWRKRCVNDWARTKTDKHANIAMWFTVSSEGTKVPGVKFLMYPMSFPADSAPEDVAERLLTCLSPYAKDKMTWSEVRTATLRRANADMFTKTVLERINYEHSALQKVMPDLVKPLLRQCNVSQGVMSHERDDVRKIYTSVYGLPMKGINPRKHGGIELINREMRVDREMPHPFRPDQMGFTRWFMVAPDDTTQEPRYVDGKPVYPPLPYPVSLHTKDLEDSDLARFQYNNYRYRPPTLTVTGEEIDNPEKMFDDFPNGNQMDAMAGDLTGSSLTDEQKLELVMPQEIIENVREMKGKSGIDKLHTVMEYEFQRSHFERMLNPDADGEDYE